MKLIRFKFRHEEWNAYLINKDEFGDFVEDKGNQETAAEVQWYKKEVYFNDVDLDLEIVKHEMVHIATGYHHIQNLSLTDDQCEEFFCDLFAHEGDYILKLSNKLYKKLEELKKSKNKNLELVLDGRED